MSIYKIIIVMVILIAMFYQLKFKMFHKAVLHQSLKEIV